MESPIVVDKPPEYGKATNTERGFPFDDAEGADGAWSQLAARHPDIAARLRARPQQWHRKRRPSAQGHDDLSDEFGGFDSFPFDDIPPEFRDHFPAHFRRAPPPAAQPPHAPAPAPAPPAPHQTTSTQTEQHTPGPSTLDPQGIPQYGLRNTVDLGQKSPVDPVVDAEERSHRSMSAPPESRNNMSGQSPPQAEQPPPQAEHGSNVRHIPIFVEGRDEPVVNKTDHAHESKPHQHAPPPPQPHFDREQYFADDGPVGFHHPTNFSRAFGTPFNKNFRQGPQPFTQQKAFPQSAFRGDSPHRSHSPKREVPVHHETPKQPQPPTPQQQQQQYQQEQQQKFQQEQQQKSQQQQQPPAPPKPQPTPNDPITLILGVQTDVLNLMTEVENFAGSKQDKRYAYLDEMLTRNLIKLDNVETEGKENIRLARKEAIRCIQKCIAVLEAKAEKGSAEAAASATGEGNGDVAMETKEEEAAPPPAQTEDKPEVADTRPEPTEEKPEETQAKPEETQEKPEETQAKPAEKTPKKKVAKIKSKGSSKVDKDNAEAMQVDPNSQMEVDGAAASQ